MGKTGKSPGDLLEELCQGAREAMMLCAPFIKVGTFERIISRIPDDVTLQCITRWRPEEVVAGVSDLEVWQLLRNRDNTSLWLRPDLHAKYYRADNKCLVGSANLTAAALGWSSQPNLELLVSLPADDPSAARFETELLTGSVQVDDSICAQIAEAVKVLEEAWPSLPSIVVDDVAPTLEPTDEEEGATEPQVPAEAWLPTLRHPEGLYLAYSGQLDELTKASQAAAVRDLRAFPVIPGLPQPAFEACAASLLLQKPIVQKVDKFVATPQRFGAVRDLLASLPCSEVSGFDASRSWQTLMRWLIYLLPDKYRTYQPHHSEMFERIR